MDGQTTPNETEFHLRGKRYRLSRKSVQRQLRGIEPRPIGKYAVNVEGRAYPPKQVLEIALNLPRLQFTTLDANRILSKLGFEVFPHPSSETVMASRRSPSLDDVEGQQSFWDTRISRRKNDPREMFTSYLFANALGSFVESEPQRGGSIPDLVLTIGQHKVVIEVKQSSVQYDWSTGAHEPTKPLRDAIALAALDLATVQDASRGLVVASRCFNMHLLSWQLVYWSMLGPKLFQQAQVPVHEEATPTLGLDAVVVLEQIPIGFLRFQKRMTSWEAANDRQPSLQEYLSEIQQKLGTESDVTLTQLRVVVHENPFAVRPFPRDLFQGPYDKRYGLREDGRIGLVFIGAEIQQFER